MAALPFELAEPVSVGSERSAAGAITTYYYSDLNSDPVINRSSSAVLTDVEAVNQQIANVLFTPIGSDEFEPTFGSFVTSTLFDSMSPETQSRLQMDITVALRKWLSSRLDFFSVSISTDPDKGNMYVSIPYRVKLTGEQRLYVGPLRKGV